jgi:hypothetical protein
MGKRILLYLAVALAVMAILPAIASADLVNDYGMHFAGQAKCTECHGIDYATTVHGRFAKDGLVPDAPAGWTAFTAAGDPPQVAGTFPIDWTSGGSYAVDQPWITLGDFEGGAATEYMYWQGSSNPQVVPWNLVEGLVAEPTGEWMVGNEDPETGLYDVVYSCQRCHQLGTTFPTKDAADASAVPNPAALTPASPTTAKQWARTAGTTVADFGADPAVSKPGMSIQCEACHGTGLERGAGSLLSQMHWNSGTQLSHRVEGASMSTLGQSQVCGQCHGSYVTTNNSLGIYGYTPNLPMRTFVDINGLSGGASYTYIPTEEEFLATPTKYFMFPNGSNAKGNHYYYDEWAASAHSYRGAYYTTDLATMSPDAMTFQAAGHGHYNATAQSSIDSKCYQCHTGEGYLKSKGTAIAAKFTPTKDNTGLMGQECVTCHSPHPAAVGDEGNIREPDAAGERSAAGLTRGNDSVCEDCHNWQYEVQGTTPVFKPLATLTARGGPSHPQRETLQGRVMVEVEAAGNFMPGAKCEDCHMPKTSKNANRFSHGMKIMLPGKAEEWNAAANAVGSGSMGEDSCSKCHAGETREELQANIDTWQEEAAAAAQAAADAITAAQTTTPAIYSLTDPTDAGYVLLGKATWNYKAFGSDASGGAHNPEYIVEALAKAEQLAKSVGGSFAHFAGPASVVPGGMGYLAGGVDNGDGTGAAGASLALYADGVATGLTTLSDAKGDFAFMISPTVATTYTVKWTRSSSSITTLWSGEVKVGIAKVASRTTLTASAKSIMLGKTVKLTGKVTPADPGKTVTFQTRRPGTAWKTRATLTLSDASTFLKKFTPKARGKWYFRVTYPGSATVGTSKSPRILVTVK